MTVLCISFVSCGDSFSTYITSINNNTNYNVFVNFPDSTIVCQPNNETIIEESWWGSGKKLSCFAPYIFRNNIAKIVIDGEHKILIKAISDNNNWNCRGEERWSLIMVGRYYSKITTTFVINDEDLKDVEHWQQKGRRLTSSLARWRANVRWMENNLIFGIETLEKESATSPSCRNVRGNAGTA